jgi:hypothetical protein
LHRARVSARNSARAARPRGGQRAAVSAHAPAPVAIQPLKHLSALLSIRQLGCTHGGECRCLNPTLRSSRHPPGYRCLRLNSNVSHLFVPSMNTPPAAEVFALSAVVPGGSVPAQASAQSGAIATTGKALEAGARWHGLELMPRFVEGRAGGKRRRAGQQSSPRCQMANPSFKRTCQRHAA